MTDRDRLDDAAGEVELLVRSRYPLIVVDTLEEKRLRGLRSRTAGRLDLPLDTWSRARGLATAVRELHEELIVSVRPSADEADRLSLNLSGFTVEEIRRALRRAVLGDRSLNRSDSENLLASKREAIARTGVVDWSPPEDLGQPVGGMRRLRERLEERRSACAESGREYGLEPPRSRMLTGKQSCGKSLFTRSMARFWNLLLVRRDPASQCGKSVGETEKILRRALATVDAMAPVVLWIDEIEKELAAPSEGHCDVELEQAVAAALDTSFSEYRELDTGTVAAEIARAIPFSVTVAKKVALLREWACGRTVPAA